MLKKTIISAVVALIGVSAAQAGAPPTVMVLPDETWANSVGLLKREEVRGRTRNTIMFDDCFLNADFKNCVVELNSLLQNYNLPPKDYSAASAGDDFEEAYDELFEDNSTGEGAASNPLDELLNRFQPDIMLRLGWDVHKAGFRYSIAYRLEAVDAYSHKAVATVRENSETVANSQPVSGLLANSANGQMGDFAARLQTYFDDIQENGREIQLSARILRGSSVDMQTEFGGQTLADIIFNWMDANTVNHRFNEARSTANRLGYDQVRMAMKDSRGRTQQARQFTNGLVNHLREVTGLKVKNETNSLGHGRITITD